MVENICKNWITLSGYFSVLILDLFYIFMCDVGDSEQSVQKCKCWPFVLLEIWLKDFVIRFFTRSCWGNVAVSCFLKMFFVFKVRVITLIPFKFDVVKKRGGSGQCLYTFVSIFFTCSMPPTNNEPEVKEKGSVSCTPHWFHRLLLRLGEEPVLCFVCLFLVVSLDVMSL